MRGGIIFLGRARVSLRLGMSESCDRGGIVSYGIDGTDAGLRNRFGGCILQRLGLL